MICILMFSRCCSCSLAGRDQKSPKCKSHLNSPSTKTIKNSLRTSQSSLHNSVTSIKFIHMFNSSYSFIYIHPSPTWNMLNASRAVRSAALESSCLKWPKQVKLVASAVEWVECMGKNHGLLRVGDVFGVLFVCHFFLGDDDVDTKIFKNQRDWIPKS